MAISVGPYSFSETDARKTLHHANDLLGLHGASPDRHRRVAAALGGLDPMRAPITELVGVLPTVWSELMGARDDVVAAGALPAASIGRVDRLSRSGGGVPKLRVDHVEVGFGGVAGDRQATRVHHGRPWQALCLWSREVIDALAADGHPIAPGAAGENVTIAGIDWPDVVPGARLLIGSVLCQVSSFAIPCSQNAQWFSDGKFGRIHHDRGPVSRVYATVLEPGAIATGDPVHLEPA